MRVPQDGDPNERPAGASDEVADRAAQGAQGGGASAAGSGSEAEQPAVGEIDDPAESSKVEQDLDELVVAEQQRDEYLDLARRTKADFENYRKRMAAEVQAASARGRAELALGLIGVIDNLERALAAVGIEPGDEKAPAEPLAEGFFLTYRELCAVLSRAGVESFDPDGERFDPTWHEALQKLPVEGVEPGSVVETMQKGYRLGEQLIRPARVVVSE